MGVLSLLLLICSLDRDDLIFIIVQVEGVFEFGFYLTTGVLLLLVVIIYYVVWLLIFINILIDRNVCFGLSVYGFVVRKDKTNHANWDLILVY